MISILLESIDGVIAGLVFGEDLGEKDAQSDPGSVDPFSPAMALPATCGLDVGFGEMIEEGQSLPAFE
jgi:hypothetical protein